MPKHAFFLFLCDTQCGEHGTLKVGFVDTDGASSKFVTIEHYVVGLCAKTRVTLAFVFDVGCCASDQFGFVFRQRSREWVVHCIPFVFLFIVTEKWELSDPEEIEFFVSFKNVLKLGANETHAA